jgi:hypothetical protein
MRLVPNFFLIIIMMLGDQVWRQHAASSFLVMIHTRGEQDNNANPGHKHIRWDTMAIFVNTRKNSSYAT